MSARAARRARGVIANEFSNANQHDEFGPYKRLAAAVIHQFLLEGRRDPARALAHLRARGLDLWAEWLGDREAIKQALERQLEDHLAARPASPHVANASRAEILAALVRADWTVSAAATSLSTSVATLYAHMKKRGLWRDGAISTSVIAELRAAHEGGTIDRLFPESGAVRPKIGKPKGQQLSAAASATA